MGMNIPPDSEFVVQSLLLSVALALPVILSVAWGGGCSYRAYRNKVDRSDRTKESDYNSIAAEFGLMPPRDMEQLKTPGSHMRAKDWLEKYHERAITLKNLYYELIGRCGVILSFTFILTAMNLTILRSNDYLDKYISTAEFLAIFYVLIHWWRAQQANQKWILKRIHSELLRQWRHLGIAFSWPEEEIAVAYPAACRRIEVEILLPRSRFWQWLGLGLTSNDLEKRIHKYWDNFSEELKAKALTQTRDNCSDNISYYIYARPVKQLGWYRMRKQQLFRAEHWRGILMIVLFLLTLLLTSANVYLAHRFTAISKFSDWLNLCLLMMTALSAMLTYWYLSRNERSMRHRYATQTREIEGWLKKATGSFSNCRTAQLYEELLGFETVMLSELIDWIHATSHDSVELGA